MLCGRPREEKGGEQGRPAGSPARPARGLTTPAPRPAAVQLGEGEHQGRTPTPRPPSARDSQGGSRWLLESPLRRRPPGFPPGACVTTNVPFVVVSLGRASPSPPFGWLARSHHSRLCSNVTSS